MAEFHLLRPFWLLALFPAVFTWWGLLKQQDQTARWRTAIDAHLLEHLLVGEHREPLFRPVHILLLLWVIASCALSGPTWQKEPSPFLGDEAGLMIVLKVTKSMESTDVQPSRLERAKHKIRDLMKARKGSSTGLIVYSGSSHLVMPMTRDSRIINSMIEDLTPNLMPVEGDVLHDALNQAEQMAAQSELPGSLVVLADTVSSNQVEALKTEQPVFPVQFLSMQPAQVPPDAGLQKAADLLDAPLSRLSVDPEDVEQIARRAKSEFAAVVETGQGEHWKDNGYLLIPLTALCMALWFRKGWVIK